MNLTVLKSEIIDDPNAYGYSGLSPMEIAIELNKVRATIQIDVDEIKSNDFINCIDITEYTALNDLQRQTIALICGRETFKGKGSNAFNILKNIFGGTSTTAINATPLLTRDGSRAEQLGLPVVYHLDVSKALAL